MTARIVLLIGLAGGCAGGEGSQMQGGAKGTPVGTDAGSAGLYAQVEQILDNSCAKQVCHGEMVANGHMNLMAGDMRAMLVDVPACEYERMMRVQPGKPEQSYIMLKIAGPVRFRGYADFVDFTPAPGWTPTTPECSGQFDDGSPWFGLHMPPADTTTIEPADIEVLRSWIAAGAPGAS
jgi:hypothetical protein